MLIFLILNQLLWAQNPSLEGRWQQSCLNLNTREELFIGRHVTLTETYYADRECQVPMLTFRNQGGFQADQRNIDFTFNHVLMTASLPAVVADFNARQVCGFNDWMVDEEREVTGLFCEIFAQGAPMQVPPADKKDMVFIK